MLESLLVVLTCVLMVALELLVCVAIFAPQAVVRAVRRIIPSPRSIRGQSPHRHLSELRDA